MVRRCHALCTLLFLAFLTICIPSLVGTVHEAHADPLLDLAVDSIWLEDASQPGQPVVQLSPGQSFSIVVTIRNLGQGTAYGFYLDVYYDSDYGRGGPDNIQASEVQTWYVGPLTAQDGTYTAIWVVDPDNLIAELDEGNNQKDYTFTIGQQTTTTTTTYNSTTTSTTSSSTTTTSTSLATVSIVVAANPLGSVVVDGITYTSAQTFAWLPGTSHTIVADSPVSGAPGIQYVWSSWTDGGTQSRTIMVPSSPTTYTANYQTQYQVAFAVNPPADGVIIVNGQPSVTAWHDDNAVVSIQANSNTGYAFSSWSSDAASITIADPSSASTTATIHGAGTITVTLIAQDTTPPVITPSVTPSANGNGWNNGPVTVSWSVSDPESGVVSSTGCTTTNLSTETPPAGTTLTCTATNGAGISNSASVTVRIDLTAPTLTLPSLTVEAIGPSGASASYDAGAYDSLSGIGTLSCVPSSGSTFPIGTTTVSCVVTDKAGNTATGTFVVTVQDKTGPVVTVPADMTVSSSGPSGAVVTFSVSASDLVDGSVPVTCTPASGSMFPVGTTKVACSATDKAGNAGFASFNVTVVVTTPPPTVPPVTVKLLGSNGNGLSGGVVQYYSRGWKPFGTTGSDGTVSMALPPGTYSFQISWAGAFQKKSQNVGKDPNVVFQTTLVTVKLLSSTNTELNGGAQYYASGWKTFSGGTTTTTMELLPVTYTFQISWAGAFQKKSQNIGKDPNVIFQTVQVHSDSGKCTSYYASGWRTFTQDMELLPGTYTFRFSDGTANKSYKIVAGAIYHIR